MSLIQRVSTIQNNQPVDGEFSNIVNILNSLDSGTIAWSNVKTGNLTVTGTITGFIGRILQVVQSTSTTSFSTTSSTFQTTNLTASITPSSTSSHVFAIASGSINSLNVGASFAIISLFRGTTNLGDATNGMALTDAVSGARLESCIFFYDSPASVSALTYSVKLKSSDNATTVKFGELAQQTLTVFEIGGV